MDSAASTPLDARVLEEMMPYMSGQFGNPSSVHRMGRAASKAVRAARAQVAELINAEPSEIVFTSGGTESDNTALRSANGRIVTSQIEHEAVLAACRRLESEGAQVDYLPVDGSGRVDMDALRRSAPGASLVSIMLANNEVGTVQPMAEISRVCRAAGAQLHTDAVQAVGRMPVDVQELGVDMLSLSGHKINGPKGCGALYVRGGARLLPLLEGGGQEGGLRSGTENVPAIVGLGAACRICGQEMDARVAGCDRLRARMSGRILAEVPHSQLNGDPAARVPGNMHFSFPGVEGEDLVVKLDEYGVAASTGSACTVNRQSESHVLLAMGLGRDMVSGSLRLTPGARTSDAEADEAVEAVKRAVSELRLVSPLRAKYGF